MGRRRWFQIRSMVVSAAVLAGGSIAVGGAPMSSAAGSSPAIALSDGGNSTCGIHADGTLSCWGAALGPAADRLPAGEFVAVDGGVSGLCGVRADATIECWGDELGASLDLAGSYQAVGLGEAWVCGLSTAGSISCSGKPRDGRLTPPGGSDFVSIAVGAVHGCAIREDASMTCWGSSFDGALDAPDGQYSQVSADRNFSCAIRTDGRIVCWGNEPRFPVSGSSVPSGRFTDIAVGGGFACALRVEATVTCWGNLVPGALEAPRGEYVDVSAGSSHACAISVDGGVDCWGDFWEVTRPPDLSVVDTILSHETGTGCFVRSGGELDCDTTGPPDYIDPATLMQFEPGQWISCAVYTDGALDCWGDPEQGALDLPAGRFTAVSVRSRGGCALRDNGRVVCWGEGSTDSLPGEFTAIATSYYDVCGLRADGDVVCDGGSPFVEDRLPDPPDGPFEHIELGNGSACGMRPAGTIVCWSAPTFDVVPPPGPHRSLSGASGRFCAVGELDDQIVCFGVESYGAQGPEGRFESVDVGGQTTCGVRLDGLVQCWGESAMLGEPFGPARPWSPPTLVARTPIRILDTRVGFTTFDGVWAGPGPLDAGEEIDLWLRSSVTYDVTAVALSVTVTNPAAPGFLTLWPCKEPRPTASSVNFVAGQTVTNTVIVRTTFDWNGVCLFTSAPTEVIADVIGSVPRGGALVTQIPARLADTRVGEPTVDGLVSGVGRIAAGETLAIPTWGRGGVAEGAASVVLNVVSVLPDAPSFLTVHPCDADRPVASNINTLGGFTTNMVFARTAADGRVCIYSSADTDIVVDVTAHVPTGQALLGIQPARLVDTRPGEPTIDGRQRGDGRVAAGETFVVEVADRATIPGDAATVMLNVAAVLPSGHGFLTVHPCGEPLPDTSAMTYTPGDVRAVAVPARVGRNGTICVFSLAETDLVIDVGGYVVGH